MEIELKRIIDQCKSNNHKAFEIVYKKYYRILLGVALRYSGNLQEAEDVSMVQAWLFSLLRKLLLQVQGF